jgi:hypothetical protein
VSTTAEQRGNGWRRSQAALCVHACSQRSLQAALRKTSSGLTLGRAHCMPAPLSRASTTSLLALSTLPLPRGQPAAAKAGYCRRATRLSKYVSASLTSGGGCASAATCWCTSASRDSGPSCLRRCRRGAHQVGSAGATAWPTSATCSAAGAKSRMRVACGQCRSTNPPDPLGASAARRDLASRLDPTPVQLAYDRLIELLDIGQARAGGHSTQLYLSGRGGCRLQRDLTDHQGFDLGPLAADQRDHRPIHTHHRPVRSSRHRWQLVTQPHHPPPPRLQQRGQHGRRPRSGAARSPR